MQETALPNPLQSFLAVAAVQLVASAAVLSLHRRQPWLQKALPVAIALAVGVLLATGTAHLLPEAVATLGNRPALWAVFVLTLLALYSVERLFQLASGVPAEPDASRDAAGTAPNVGPPHPLAHHGHRHAARPAALLFGSLTHSLVDGTGIAAAFTLDLRLGWVTALAVALHEVPHRLGDFAVLLHLGLGWGRAAALAIAAGGSSLLGWLLVVLLGEAGSARVAWLLPISAASFLYISLVDLLPELAAPSPSAQPRSLEVFAQLAALAAGIALGLGLTHLPGA